MKRLIPLVLLIIILCSVSITIRSQEENRQHPYRYLIPKGYIGWVRVDFNVKDAPALLIENGYYIFKIPATGRLQTSSDDGDGILEDQYFYVCGEIRVRLSINQGSGRSMIWGDFMGPAFLSESVPYKYRYFFVGPQEEYGKHQYGRENQAKTELEEDGYPKVGTERILPCEKK
jgi:hypothetical protein